MQVDRSSQSHYSKNYNVGGHLTFLNVGVIDTAVPYPCYTDGLLGLGGFLTLTLCYTLTSFDTT